jgi:hypothetical protein
MLRCSKLVVNRVNLFYPDIISKGSAAHDRVSEEEERAQPYTVPVGQMESISFQKKIEFRLGYGNDSFLLEPLKMKKR